MQFNKINLKNETIKGFENETDRMPSKIEMSSFETRSIGEDKNQNIRTRVEKNVDTERKFREEEKLFSDFKLEAREGFGRLEKMRESLSPEVLEKLSHEGISVEDSGSSLVEKNVDHILKNREIRREHLKNQVEKMEQVREDIERMAISDLRDKTILSKLEQSGIPVTKENVKKLSNVLELADEAIAGINEPVMKNMIEQGLPETVLNLYKVEHFSDAGHKLVGEAKEILWEDIKEEASERLYYQGVEKTKEHLEAAKWLFQNDLEINSDNVADYLGLTELKEDFKEYEEREKIYHKITDTLAGGEDPLNTVLGKANGYRAKYSLFYFKSVIEKKSAFYEVSARKQIEEIRLKLTEETALSMLAKGIKIDVSDLRGLVENLRAEEESYFRSLSAHNEKGQENRMEAGKENRLKEPFTEPSHEFEWFKRALSIRSYRLRQGSESAFSDAADFEVFRSDSQISIREYYKAGIAYEASFTEVRYDLGDRVKKAFSNLDEILEQNGFEPTKENRRAVKLLVYNHAEVNEEAILKMKKASLLSYEVFYEMKPKTVANLVKSGINPLDLPMEELLLKLKGINEALKPEDERFSSFLYRLDQAGEITKEERQAYIGIYRLLSQIEKGDGASVGSVALAGKTLTLRNLLEAVRIGKVGRFDQKVEETFGELKRGLSENRIDKMIETAYLPLLAGKIKEDMEEAGRDYYSVKRGEIQSQRIQLSDVEKLIETGETIGWSAAVAQSEIRGGRKSLKTLFSSMTEEEKEEIAKSASETLEKLDDILNISKQMKRLQETMLQSAQRLLQSEDITYAKAGELIGMKKVLALSMKRAEKETYDIPILSENGQYADLQITLRKGRFQEDKGKVSVRLSMEEAEVGVQLRVVNQRISGIFFSDDRERLERLRAKQGEFKRILLEMEWTEGEITYHLGKSPLEVTNLDDIYSGRVETKELFQLAKKTTAHIFAILGF